MSINLSVAERTKQSAGERASIGYSTIQQIMGVIDLQKTLNVMDPPHKLISEKAFNSLMSWADETATTRSAIDLELEQGQLNALGGIEQMPENTPAELLADIEAVAVSGMSILVDATKTK